MSVCRNGKGGGLKSPAPVGNYILLTRRVFDTWCPFACAFKCASVCALVHPYARQTVKGPREWVWCFLAQVCSGFTGNSFWFLRRAENDSITDWREMQKGRRPCSHLAGVVFVLCASHRGAYRKRPLSWCSPPLTSPQCTPVTPTSWSLTHNHTDNVVEQAKNVGFQVPKS